MHGRNFLASQSIASLDPIYSVAAREPGVLSETLKRELARYAVGGKIRAMRQQKALSLDEIAKRSHISISLLSKIERGKSVPSLSALSSIAAAFDVTLAFFFPKPSSSLAAVTRSQERILMPESPRGKHSAFDFESLSFSAIEPRLDCYHAHFRPGVQSRPHVHPGAEFLFVLSGSLAIFIADEQFVLEEGDSVYFDSGLTHSYANASKNVCRALVISLPALPAIAELDDQTSLDALHVRNKKITLHRAG